MFSTIRSASRRMAQPSDPRSGLTFIEIIVSVSLLVIVTGLGLYMLNPGTQLARSRNTKRQFDINALMIAVRQNIADKNTGAFNCANGDIPTSTKRMASSGTGTSTFNIAPCLVPTYLSTLPFDPSGTSTRYVSNSDYDTGYTIVKNASSQITISAPGAEYGQTISITR